MSLLAMIISFVIQTASHVYAELPTDCMEVFKIIGEFQYHRRMHGSTCYLSVHPRNDTSLVYRDYIFSSDGTLLVFNSFGDGEEVSTTGARVYTFFPRTIKPFFEVSNKGVEVSTFHSDIKFVFSLNERKLIASEGFDFIEDENVSPDNKGGIQIKIRTGLLLDSGYAMGNDPRMSKKNISVFKNSDGQTCNVLNKEIFQYQNNDISYRYSDLQTKDFLRKKCPEFITYLN